MYFIYHGPMSYVWKPKYLPWGITLPRLFGKNSQMS